MTSTGFFSYDALLDGFLWAVESGAEVVCIASGDKYVNPDFEKALQATARDRGTLVLAAVGNDGRSGEDAGMFPARCEHALAVGSVNHEGRLSTFTDLPLGKNVIAVPGENLMAESMSSEMAHYSGTSFAACVLAGWLAIWQGQRKMKNITKSLTSSEILAQCKGVESPRGPCYLFDPTRPLLAS
jgi:subtilisin family serine protease